MRAWRVHELGDPSQVMSLDEIEQPTPGEGQVLVKVQAAALNFPDVLMAMGMYQEKPPLPYIPGVELCGEIVETGQRVHRLAVGRARAPSPSTRSWTPPPRSRRPRACPTRRPPRST